MQALDWIILIAFLLLIVAVGVSYTKKASKSLSSFFVGGRNLPWYIAGVSMVATTFAADTPLAVTELVGQSGIAGNWLWWNMLMGGMLTTFFFARLWRRSGVITEVELIEMRYSGKEASFLRGFKAVYLGVFMNMLIIGWVNVALMSLLQVFFGIEAGTALLVTAFAMLFVAIYSSMSGLLGVAMTDVIQFIVAMIGCIVLAILVVGSEQIGGISGMKSQLESISPNALNFLPQVGGEATSEEANVGTTLALGFGAFFAYVGIQWWASWYPGAEPGGGGYVAQRMLSAKDEKHAIYSTLFFQVAHYCIRPWPWILVGLCALILYPDLSQADKKLGFVMAMNDFLPVGLKGLLLAAFFAAYMSTISTQLNWGAGYLVNDFYKRFMKPQEEFESMEKAQKHYVAISRVATILLMVLGLSVTFFIESISGVWKFIIECGAGLGLVLILRWYWWRINAWSEITATIAPFIAYAFSRFVLGLEFPQSFFVTVGFTTVAWLVVTFITQPTDMKTLQSFYHKIRPDGFWGAVRTEENEREKSNLPGLIICWLSATVLTYSILFLSGKLILMEWQEAGNIAIVTVLSGLILAYFVRKTRIFAD